MSAAKKKGAGLISHGLVAQNRKARHDYTIEDTFEAGLLLAGAEVKSLRHGRANITESYAGPDGDELWLFNAYIPEYQSSAPFTPNARRKRKLLVKRGELRRLFGLLGRQGATLVPLRLYFNDRGIAKVQLGVATGKKKVDKRAAEKERDWQREKARLLRDKG